VIEIFSDMVQPFLIDKSSIKGKLVRLSESLTSIINGHNYPDAVSKQLSELMVIVAMLGASLKMKGILTAQMRSNGAINFLVADCTSDGDLRGYAGFDAQKISALGADAEYHELVGDGYLAITLDYGIETDKYQGVVELKGSSLTCNLRDYFINSEQVDAEFKIFVGNSYDADGNKTWIAGGVMVQKMPDEGGIGGKGQIRLDAYSGSGALDAWNRAKAFVGTLRDFEILDVTVPPQELVYKLFHEDGVWAFEPKIFRALCRCNRDKITSVLASLDAAELEDLKVDGKISVVCQFCNKEEVF